MIKSMTGYGKGEHTAHDRRFTVEIRAVNHRYGDITIKLPRFLNAFEDRVKKRLLQTIQRGKVDAYITFETFSESDIQIRVNTAFARAYTNALRELTICCDLTDPPTLQNLTAFPDLFVIDKNVLNETSKDELWETLSVALEQAIGQFSAMRAAEGASLQADMIGKKEIMRQLLNRVKKRAPQVSEEYAQRLKERVTEALANAGLAADENRLLTEIALFADRACIDEEITRLTSHFSQLEHMLAQSEPIGRKLDFLVQEINREINTIGSKSNDVTLTRLVVDLKAEAEKIREQVQNIE